MFYAVPLYTKSLIILAASDQYRYWHITTCLWILCIIRLPVGDAVDHDAMISVAITGEGIGSILKAGRTIRAAMSTIADTCAAARNLTADITSDMGAVRNIGVVALTSKPKQISVGDLVALGVHENHIMADILRIEGTCEPTDLSAEVESIIGAVNTIKDVLINPRPL